jgi:hypothetical protein
MTHKKPPRKISGVAKVQGGGADLQRRRASKGGEMLALFERWEVERRKSIQEMYFSASARQKALSKRENAMATCAG